MNLFRTFTRVFYSGLLLYFLTQANVYAGKQPNIIILVAGDLGPDIGCYGNTSLLTTHIDQLADKGILCRNAFVTSPQNTPSVISMLTGAFPHTTRTEDSNIPLGGKIKTLVQYLQSADYKAGYAGKPGLFDSLANTFDWTSGSIGDFNQFLSSARKKPFFFLADLNEPARPFLEGMISQPYDESSSIVKNYFIDNLETRNDIAKYYDAISQLDSMVGIYTSALKDFKKEKNTLVIFISKNGASFPREKGTLYDAGIRVPLIFSGTPVSAHGAEYDGQISIIDLFTTILSICGIDYPAQMAGLDFSQMLKGNITLGRDYIYSERNWDGTEEHIRCIRTGDYKLILNSYTGKMLGLPPDVLQSPAWHSLLERKESGNLSPEQSLNFIGPRPQIELYDLNHDPDELNNIAGNPEYARIVRDMLTELQAWMENTGDFPPDRRTRADQTDRITGKLLRPDIPPLENDVN